MSVCLVDCLENFGAMKMYGGIREDGLCSTCTPGKRSVDKKYPAKWLIEYDGIPNGPSAVCGYCRNWLRLRLGLTWHPRKQDRKGWECKEWESDDANHP
jgi:hypothetical protein